MFDKTQLLTIIQDQRSTILPKNYVERDCYAHLQTWSNNDYVIVISGMRRTGKSTLLQKLRTSSSEQDFYMNFDDDRLFHFTASDFQLLFETFVECFGEQKTFYFDEIQNIVGWERFVRRLHDQHYKVYITGSNSNLMSKELGTHLTGRYLQLEVYPYSFHEWLGFKAPSLLKKKNYSTVDKGIIKRHFHEYEMMGGIPEYVSSQIPESLSMLYHNILYRDIVVRFKISNDNALKSLTHYIASNIGKELSFNKLKTTLGLGSASTVSDYCKYLEGSYLCFLINRYAPSLQKQMGYNKKCYMIDIALARQIGFRFSDDRGRLLENIVFLALKQQPHEIYFHQGKTECDFIIKKGSIITEAIQVCLSLNDPATYERETKGLLEAMNTYNLSHGLIITENEHQDLELDGYQISIRPIWSWLLHNNLRKTTQAI